MGNFDRPVIHAADLHMDPHIWKGRPEITGDADFALYQISHLCQKYGANLILAGDLTNSRRGYPGPVTTLQTTIEALLDVDCEVGYVCGNHDPESWIATSSRLQSRVYHLGSGKFQIGDHHVFGMDYIAGRTRLQEEFADIPTWFDVLVCHQRFHEAFGWDTYHCSMEDVPEHLKLVLAGDIHQQWDAKMPDGRRLLYPGCPYLRRVNDSDDHGVWLIGTDLSVKWLPLRARPVLRLLLESSDDITLACKAIREAAEKARIDIPTYSACQAPLALIRFYPHECPGAIEAIEDVVRNIAHVIPLPQEREQEQLLQELKDQQLSGGFMERMRAFLGQEVDQAKNPVLFDTVDSFLTGTDINDVVVTAGKRVGVADKSLVELTGKR